MGRGENVESTWLQKQLRESAHLLTAFALVAKDQARLDPIEEQQEGDKIEAVIGQLPKEEVKGISLV